MVGLAEHKLGGIGKSCSRLVLVECAVLSGSSAVVSGNDVLRGKCQNL